MPLVYNEETGAFTGKWTADDFKNRNTINEALIAKVVNSDGETGETIDVTNQNDEDGYTPLCFAATNNIRQDLYVYLIKNKGALKDRKCNKGRMSPIRAACVAMGDKAIEAFIGESILLYKDDKNNSPDYESPDPDGKYKYKPVKDSDNNIIFAKDQEGNLIPLRDDNDEILYEILDDSSEDTRDYSYVDPNDASIKMYHICLKSELPEPWKSDDNLKIYKPLLSDDKIQLKWDDDKDDDGNDIKVPAPMRDQDGNPIKLADKNSDDGYKHKLDKEGKPLRNKFIYFQDYEYLSEYTPEYVQRTDNITPTANFGADEIIEASKLPKGECITLLLNKKYTVAHNTTDLGAFVDEQTQYIPICLAAKARCCDSVDILLHKDSNWLANIQKLCPILPSGGERPEGEKPESALSVVYSNKDVNIFKLFRKHCGNNCNTFSGQDNTFPKLMNVVYNKLSSCTFPIGVAEIVYDEIHEISKDRIYLKENNTYKYITQTYDVPGATRLLKFINDWSSNSTINEDNNKNLENLVIDQYESARDGNSGYSIADTYLVEQFYSLGSENKCYYLLKELYRNNKLNVNDKQLIINTEDIDNHEPLIELYKGCSFTNDEIDLIVNNNFTDSSHKDSNSSSALVDLYNKCRVSLIYNKNTVSVDHFKLIAKTYWRYHNNITPGNLSTDADFIYSHRNDLAKYLYDKKQDTNLGTSVTNVVSKIKDYGSDEYKVIYAMYKVSNFSTSEVDSIVDISNDSILTGLYSDSIIGLATIKEKYDVGNEYHSKIIVEMYKRHRSDLSSNDISLLGSESYIDIAIELYRDSAIGLQKILENNDSVIITSLYNHGILTDDEIVSSYNKGVTLQNLINDKNYYAINKLYENKLASITPSLSTSDVTTVKNSAANNNLDNNELHVDLNKITFGLTKTCKFTVTKLYTQYYWMMNFSNIDDLDSDEDDETDIQNWYRPSLYPVLSPIVDDDLVTVSTSSSRYKRVILVPDSTHKVTSVSKFRLNTYDSSPEIYTNTLVNSFDENNNCVVVLFGSAVSDQKFVLPSSGVYTLLNGKITWASTQASILRYTLSGYTVECTTD